MKVQQESVMNDMRLGSHGPIIPYLPSVDEMDTGDGCCAQDRACLLLQTPDAIAD